MLGFLRRKSTAAGELQRPHVLLHHQMQWTYPLHARRVVVFPRQARVLLSIGVDLRLCTVVQPLGGVNKASSLLRVQPLTISEPVVLVANAVRNASSVLSIRELALANHRSGIKHAHVRKDQRKIVLCRRILRGLRDLLVRVDHRLRDLDLSDELFPQRLLRLS